jgi:hypothetical protein
MHRKILFPVGIIVISLLGELLLWNNIVLFSALLIALAYIKHLIFPIKREFLWYISVSVIGFIIEIILVNFGHGWTYVNPDLFGVPIWIPLFWGLVGTTIVVIYSWLQNR